MESENDSQMMSARNIALINIPVLPLQEQTNHTHLPNLATVKANSNFSSITPVSLGSLSISSTNESNSSRIVTLKSDSDALLVPSFQNVELESVSPNSFINIDSIHSLLPGSHVVADSNCLEISNQVSSSMEIPIIKLDKSFPIFRSNVNDLSFPKVRVSDVFADNQLTSLQLPLPNSTAAISIPNYSIINSFSDGVEIDKKLGCKKRFRPIRPSIRNLNADQSNVLSNLYSSSAPKDIDVVFSKKPSPKSTHSDCISIVKCELDTLDSCIENAIITVDDIKIEDIQENEIGIANTSICSTSLETMYDGHDTLTSIENPQKSFSSFDEKDAQDNATVAGNEYEFPCEFESVNSSDSLCFLCGLSFSQNMMINVCSCINGFDPSKSLESVCEILGSSADVILSRSKVVCIQCTNTINETEKVRLAFLMKQREIQQIFSNASSNFDSIRNISKSSTKFSSTVAKRRNDTSGDKRTNPSPPFHRSSSRRTAAGLTQKQEKNIASCGNFYEDLGEASNVEIEKRRDTIRKKKRRKRFPCDDCSKSFPDRRSLLTHSASHKRGFDCRVCGRFLTTKTRLTTHLFKFHGIGEPKHKSVCCDQCDKTFQTKQGLAYHQNVVHQIGTKYECPHCQKIFFYHVLYRSHLLYAHGKKKIVCETCGEMFFTVSKLNTHINAVHRNAKTWQCIECDTKFTTGTAFRHHNLVKHRDSKYSCEHCDSQFRKKSSLIYHQREHNIFGCGLCKQTFSNEASHASHMAEVHNQVVAKTAKKRPTTNSVNVQKKIRTKFPLPGATMLKVPKIHVDSSNDLNRINFNDILLSNPYETSSHSMEIFNSNSPDKLNKMNVSGPSNNIQSFSLMEPENELQVTAHPNTLTLGDGVSFINVEILDNIPMNEEATLQADLPDSNVQLSEQLNRVDEISNLDDNLVSLRSVMNENLESHLNATASYSPSGNTHVVVEELVKQAVDGITVSEFDPPIDRLDDDSLCPSVDNLESSVDELRPISIRPGVEDLECVVNDLPGSVVNMEPSVHELCPVDIDPQVTELGGEVGNIVPQVEDFSSSGIVESVTLGNSDEALVIAETSTKTMESSSIWLKQNAWAMLKGTSSDENLGALQNISNPTIEDLDIGVIDGDIVTDDVISAGANIDLDINVADKEENETLSVLDTNIPK